MSHYELDARRMFCPMPVIRAQDKIKELQVGDTLEVVATDPGVLNDIPAWSRNNGNKVLATRQVDDEVFVLVEVCESK